MVNQGMARLVKLVRTTGYCAREISMRMAFPDAISEWMWIKEPS